MYVKGKDCGMFHVCATVLAYNLPAEYEQKYKHFQ
jgi:hypothetical protein